MLGTLDFTGPGHWAPFDYSQSTALAVCTCTHCASAFMRNNYLKKKKNIQTNTQKRKNKKNKKATCTPTEKLDKSFSKKQKCNRTRLIISWTIPKDLQKDTFIYSR